jgi:hypothetical protein
MVETCRSCRGDVVIFADSAQSLLAACPWLAAHPFWAEDVPELVGYGDRFLLEAPFWYLESERPEVLLYDWDDGQGTRQREMGASYGWTDCLVDAPAPEWWRLAHATHYLEIPSGDPSRLLEAETIRRELWRQLGLTDDTD